MSRSVYQMQIQRKQRKRSAGGAHTGGYTGNAIHALLEKREVKGLEVW